MPARRRIRTFLLPGFDGSGKLYQPFLAAGPTRLAPELVSYPPDRPLGYRDLERLVRERLPRRGRFALLAESFSGPVAVRLAADPPPGLEALVLAATFLHRPLNPLLHPLRGLVGARFFGLPLPAAAIRWFLAGEDAPEPILTLVRESVATVEPEVLARRAAEVLAVDAREALSRARVPALWIAPERDRLLRRDGVGEVLALRPDAEVALVDGPHMILQRRPHACLARIEEFLAAPGARAGVVA